jgi:hypothetical protein
MILNPNIFSGYSIHVLSPDGPVYVHCTEDHTGRLNHVIINIGKAGSPLHAWADSLSRMITAALPHKDLQDILAELSNITSIKAIRTDRGIYVKSGPDAVYYALVLYMQTKKSNNKRVEVHTHTGFARIRK